MYTRVFGLLMFSRSLFIFRRDLRLEDNTMLIRALKESKEVVCAFMFDDRQVKKNEYFSSNGFEFMLESLEDLDKSLKKAKGRLYYFKGVAHEVVKRIIKDVKIDAVFVNRDYTPFSKARDEEILSVCRKAGIEFCSGHDALLHYPGEVMNGSGNPYKVFTPFYRKAVELSVSVPAKNNKSNYYTKKISFSCTLMNVSKKNEFKFVSGGRIEGLKILKNLGDFGNYKGTRDDLSLEDGTTHLASYNKFGCMSIREVYYALVKDFDAHHDLVRQIFWRDFYYHLASHFPHVFKGAFVKKYDAVKWSGSSSHFEKWKAGRTGYPLVDAAMRQLNKTGFMHNRARMVVASFLTKDLHVHWQKGEKYFATKLIDYDPCVNNGSWQWAASTGADAQPYFRIFNPFRQQERFDKHCVYIKKWVDELKEHSAKDIHNHVKVNLDGYVKPIVDHKEMSDKAKGMFSVIR